jgi:hypothetical protein
MQPALKLTDLAQQANARVQRASSKLIKLAKLAVLGTFGLVFLFSIPLVLFLGKSALIPIAVVGAALAAVLALLLAVAAGVGIAIALLRWLLK